MSLKDKAKAFIALHGASTLPKNARTYSFRTWTGEANHNMLGGVSYLSPSEGTVVAIDEEFTLVKTGRNSFDVMCSHLLDKAVSVGDKVALAYYQLLRFDGTKADGSGDPAIGYSRTFSLTGARSTFPVKWEGRYLGINERFSERYTAIQNPYLRDLINQLESLRLDDGSDRKVVNAMIDAGAKNLEFNDPEERESCDNPPAISMSFDKAKFANGGAGELRISYDRAMDTYTVLLSTAGSPLSEIENVHMPELPEAISNALEDGSWAKVKVTILKKAPVKRITRELEALPA